MSTLSWRGLDVEYLDVGQGPAVILIHGGASNYRQWDALTDQLKNRFRVLAVNLRGTGKTSAWEPGQPQNMADQTILIEALADLAGTPVSLVGHSFGGTIAMAAALGLKDRLDRMVLIEPNPFFLLARKGYEDGAEDIARMGEPFRQYGEQGDWASAGFHFIEYWFGEGAWAALGEKRQAGVLTLLPTVLDAFPTCSDPLAEVEAWAEFADRTLLITSADTRLSVKRIRDQMRDFLPGLTCRETPEGGHMAAVQRPELVNPEVIAFLDQARASSP